jgi:galactose oxidase-like protein
MVRTCTRLLRTVIGAGNLGWILIGTALTAQSLPVDTWQREIVLNNRRDHAMAYHAVSAEVVLFGGEGAGNAFLNDTWEWDGERWTLVNPKEVPPARSGHTLTYDFLRQRVVLFGGQDESGRRADTWAFDGETWVRLDPESTPPVRTRHAAAYDTDRQQMVAFGGLGTAKPVSDTWCFLPIRLRVAQTDVSPGEAIAFALDLPDQKKRYYLCALAFHRAPGVPLPVSAGQVVLPLLPDALTAASLNLVGFWGKLDALGQASFSVKVKNDRRLAGVKFFASALTFDDQNRIHAVTNEVGVVILE